MTKSSTNGKVSRIDLGLTTTSAKQTTKPRRPAVKKGLTTLQKAALITGGIGSTALGLSVIHCTQSIDVLTGCGTPLAAMLAVTLDAGMVACEGAEVVAHESREYSKIRPWTLTYIILVVIVSMVLNAIGSALHAEPSMKLFSYTLGAVVPVLVFILGRISVMLWTAKAR